MTEERRIRVDEVVRLLDSHPQGQAWEAAFRFLRRLSPTLELSISQIPVDHILRIYIRREKRGSNVYGVTDLVAALKRSSERTMWMFTRVDGDEVLSMWFDGALTGVIGCTLGSADNS